jgi:hypothetical protein
MAIRYSGDVEVRVSWDPTLPGYRGTVRGRSMRWRGAIAARRRPRDEDLSKAYDEAAVMLLRAAERAAKARGRHFELEDIGGRIQVSRMFQAPCPTGANVLRREQRDRVRVVRKKGKKTGSKRR